MLVNRAREFTSTVGTGPISLNGALPGFVAFSEGLTSGDKVPYVIEDGDNFEIGEGTYISNAQFERTNVFETLFDGVFFSDLPSAIALSGSAQIYVGVNSRELDTKAQSSNPTFMGESAFNGKIINNQGSGDYIAAFRDNYATFRFGESESDSWLWQAQGTKAVLANSVAGVYTVHQEVLADGTAQFKGNDVAEIGGLTLGGGALFEGAATADNRLTFSQTTAGLSGHIQQGSSGFSMAALGAQSLFLQTNGVNRLEADLFGNFDYNDGDFTNVGNVSMTGSSIERDSATSSLSLYGGSGLQGANIILYGQSHPSQAFDISLRSGGAIRALWDNSENRWDYQNRKIFGANEIHTYGGMHAETAVAASGSMSEALVGTGNRATFMDYNSGKHRVGAYDYSGGDWQDLHVNGGYLKVGGASQPDVTVEYDLIVDGTACITEIYRKTNGASVAIGGGTAWNQGFTTYFYGSAHSSKPGHAEFFSGGVEVGEYYASTNTWDFKSETIKTTGLVNAGSLQLTGSYISGGYGMYRGADNGNIYFAGGADQNKGGNMILYGPTHGSAAGDILFRSGTNARLRWDESELHWSFQDKDLTAIGDLTMTGDLNVNGGDIIAGGKITLPNNTDYRASDSGGTARTIIRMTPSDDLNVGTSVGDLVFIGNGYSEIGRWKSGGTLNASSLATFADDAAAGAGGLVAGDIYKTSTGELRIKL